MPIKKKRASFSKTPHIAVAAQVSTLEDDQEVSVHTSPTPDTLTPTATEHPHTEDTSSAVSEASLEDMLASDVQEPALTKKNIWMYRVGLLSTLVIVAVSTLIYVSFISQAKTVSVAVPTPIMTPSPTPQPIQKSAITVEVLNGSGISGKAQKTALELQAKGYTIVSTGNAKKIPLSTVQFSAKVSKQAMDLVLLDLKEYDISSISADPLVSSVSARITLGLQ